MQQKRLNDDYIVKEYLKGRTQKAIAKELNTYNTSIRRVLLRNNIKPRGNHIVQRIVKHNFLQNLKDPSVQYWLGLLATDGCITKNYSVILDLQKKDRHVLEDYIKFSGYPLKLRTTTHKKTGIKSHRVDFSNKELVEFLESIGIARRKSLDMELKIPITFAMLRGIIDGDGSFSRINKTRARLNITTGSKKFAQQVFNFLKENNFNPTLTSTISNRKNRYYSVNMFRQKELSLLYDLLYSDAKYFLKRKYLKIGSLLGKPSK